MTSRVRDSLLRGLRDRLRAADFTADELRRLLGVRYPDDVGLLNRAPMLERLRADQSAAAALARLFYLEAEEATHSLRRAIPLADLAALGRAGLISRRGVAIAARLRLDVVDDLYVLADRRFGAPDLGALGLPAGDMVYPAGSDSALLAEVVVAVEGSEVLDLCTGSGVQGLAVARRARHVTAVDIGQRAVAMARMNARLNGFANFEARPGDLFGPVAGRRFDLIVANPPFVASPGRGPAYHSGGRRGDRVFRRVMTGLGNHLRPGGRAFLISHLAMRPAESVESRLGPWISGFPGRVLALVLEAGSPVDLAAAQALYALDGGFAAYGCEVREWTQYLRKQKVTQVLLVVVVAERRGGHRLDVVQAVQRVLPLPLSRQPREEVADWLGLT